MRQDQENWEVGTPMKPKVTPWRPGRRDCGTLSDRELNLRRAGQGRTRPTPQDRALEDPANRAVERGMVSRCWPMRRGRLEGPLPEARDGGWPA